MLENMSQDLAFEKNVGGTAVSSIFCVGAMVSGLLAGPFEKATGKFAQLCIGVLYASGNILAGFTTDSKVCWGGPFGGCVADMLFAGRVLTGLAVSCWSFRQSVTSQITDIFIYDTSVVRYLAAVSPPDI